MTTAAMIHTPGVYYALTYWLACNLLIWFSPKRLNSKQRIVVQGIFLTVLVSIMTLSDDKSNVMFVPLMLLYIGMIYGDIYINCLYDARTAVHFAVRAFIVGEFAASFEWHIYYYAINNWKIPHSRLTDLLFVTVIHALLFITFAQLEKKNREINAKLRINYSQMVSTLTIGVIVFIMSNFSFIFENSPFSSPFISEIFFIRTLVDLGGVAILFGYHVQLGELMVNLEKNRLQDMLNMQYNNYEMLEKSLSAVNQKYHDLKYQIAILKQEANAEKSIAYLSRMEEEIRMYEAQNKTGHRVLDTILTGKSLYCKQNWIEMTVVADGQAISFMDDMDISTLFGNALDNAIEGAEKVQNKEKKLIHVAVAKQNGFLRIRIENCFDEKLTFFNGLPNTTKKDTKNHGYGLKSIESTATKYGGTVSIHTENSWFELRILIPIPEELSKA